MNLKRFVGHKIKSAEMFEDHVFIEFEDCSSIKVFLGEEKELCVATAFVQQATKRHEDDDDIEWVEWSKYGVRASSSQHFYPTLPSQNCF